jgi:hypothetical protein
MQPLDLDIGSVAWTMHVCSLVGLVRRQWLDTYLRLRTITYRSIAIATYDEYHSSMLFAIIKSIYGAHSCISIVWYVLYLILQNHRFLHDTLPDNTYPSVHLSGRWDTS